MYAQDPYGDTGMGIALPAIGGAISTIGGLFSGSKDSGRLDSNAKAYSQALSSPMTLFKDQGVQPTAFLLMKSPTSKGGQGGWATSVAQNDAWTKYSSARTTLLGRKYTFNPDGSVNAPPGQAYAPQPQPSTGGVVTAGVGGPVVAGLSSGPLVIAGLAAVAIFALSRK